MAGNPKKLVTFTDLPSGEHKLHVPPIRRSKLKMAIKVYETVNGREVTDEMLEEAAQLFSENYGVWAEEAAKTLGKFAKAGRLANVWLEFVVLKCCQAIVFA